MDYRLRIQENHGEMAKKPYKLCKNGQKSMKIMLNWAKIMKIM
jgi:hypothetical protein